MTLCRDVDARRTKATSIFLPSRRRCRGHLGVYGVFSVVSLTHMHSPRTIALSHKHIYVLAQSYNSEHPLLTDSSLHMHIARTNNK